MTPSETIQAFLDEIEGLYAAATKGPWKICLLVDDDKSDPHEIVSEMRLYVKGNMVENNFIASTLNDYAMIDFSRTALPKAGRIINFIRAALVCLRLEVHPYIVESIEEQIAAILDEK